MNRGVVTSMQGKYEESNELLEQAYILAEDYLKNYFNEAVSFLTNPNFVEYKGEDFELMMIHYYKALNFIKMNNNEAALVECRRMNIRLNQFNDKYKSENKYKRDAFIHNLMGIIYEASGDYNNAFIAYRNAVDIYREDYQKLFGINAPEQLKKDLIRSAYLTGFKEDGKKYEESFGIKYEPLKKGEGQLLFIWHNGLGPVKTEWGINFIGVKGQGKLLTFENEEYGFSFPFFLDEEDDYEEKGLSKLQVLRVVFPKYTERQTVFNQASLSHEGKAVTLEKAEDINAIAFKSLNQRMVWEMSRSLLRLALKKATEYTVKKENDDLGAVVGMINAITEQADTRNWQTLPHTIYYSRISLPEGEQKVKLDLKSPLGKSQENEIAVNIKQGKTTFHTFHSLETSNTGMLNYGY